MTEHEAIDRANVYVMQTYGIQAEPTGIRYIKNKESPSYWSILYGPEVLYPKDMAEGAIVDGGELFLRVDDASGVVSVYG